MMRHLNYYQKNISKNNSFKQNDSFELIIESP